MTLWQPSRRELIKSVSAAVAVAAVPSKVFASPATPLRFLVIGDWGRGGRPDQVAVANVAKKVFDELGCEFVVSTGDNFYNWGVRSPTSQAWLTSFENVYHPSLKRNWFSVLGNHDYAGSVEAQLNYRSPVITDGRHGTPSWGWRMDDRWWRLSLGAFGRPDVSLFFLDTVTWQGKESFPQNLLGDHVRFGDSARQAQWLADKLAATPGIKIAFGHHPIYSVGPHGNKIQNFTLDPILRNGGASAYIHGHDHCLYYIREPGMDYICSGAGSQVLHQYTGDSVSGCVFESQCPNPYLPNPAIPEWLEFITKGGIAVVTVHDRSLEFSFRTVDGGSSRSWVIPAKL